MIDADVRALLVKSMTEQQLTRLHLWEDQHGVPIHPAGAVEILHTTPLKRHYGIPEKRGRIQVKALREWGARVRAVMDRFTRERDVRFTTENLEDLHAFDRIVFSSDIDFYYRTAAVAKRVTSWRNDYQGAA